MSVQINLGCGDQCIPGFVGLDRLARKGTNVVCDLNDPLPLSSNCADLIYAKSVLEHIEGLEHLVGEIWRVLKRDGLLHVYVPHWRNPFYYSDYTHVRFFGLATFDYFAAKEEQVFRSVPTYGPARFRTVQVRLLFKSPFSGLHLLMKGFQWLVNRRPAWQLFYEYHLSTFVPCYAIEYALQKADPA